MAVTAHPPTHDAVAPEAPAAEPIARLLIPELDKCIQCGFCLQHCPTYRILGLETESPRGRIHLVEAAAQGRIPIDSRFEEHMYVCLGCRACETVCPAGVKFGTIIEAARAEIGPTGSPLARWATRLVLRHLLPYPGRLRWAAKALRLYQRSGLGALARVLHLIPRRAAEMEALLPRIPDRFFAPEQEVFPAIGQRRARVGMLSGCAMSVLLPDVNAATIRVLQRNGCEVVVPRSQACCGALNVHNGERDAARRMARRNIEVFLDAGVDAVIINAAGCGAASKEYPILFRDDDPAYAQRAEQYSRLCRDVTEFLSDLGLVGSLGEVRARATYQDPCHLVHGQGIRRQPRALLRQIPGLDLVEMTGSDRCCGSAGIYNLTQPGYARMVLDEKMAALTQTGADLVVAPNPGCMMQIASGIRARGLRMQVRHLIDLLDQAYAAAETDAVRSAPRS
ncbi:MAG TPA: heterodisulfide reductase-related iron-sulfur binding cluster [bacterium]|nr:heterodisulfide reductase-related iron-sulfur binding cluster [bacterium]